MGNRRGRASHEDTIKKYRGARAWDLGSVPTGRSEVEQLVRKRLTEGCPYAYYFRDVKFDYDAGTLTLRGRLGSFNMKQVLQTLLRDIDGVARIDNRVGVVSSTGLSSVVDN